jgi:hypothetical protein
VARRIEAFELDRFADLDDVAGAEAAVDIGNRVLGVGVSQQGGAGGGNNRLVAAGMVTVLVGVEHAGDGPALGLGQTQALLVIQRVDGHGLAAIGAGDQVIKIPVRVSGPDLLDDHGDFLHKCSGAV